MNYNIAVFCPHCKNEFKTPVRGNFGKKMLAKCTHCSKTTKVTIPEEQEFKNNNAKCLQIIHGTVFLQRDQTELLLRLEVKPNEFHEQQFLSIKQDVTTIGRDATTSNADIKIKTTDRYMSRVHMNIIKKPNGRYLLKDNASTGGTYLNDTKLETDDELYLNEGDVIKIGKSEINVRLI